MTSNEALLADTPLSLWHYLLFWYRQQALRNKLLCQTCVV